MTAEIDVKLPGWMSADAVSSVMADGTILFRWTFLPYGTRFQDRDGSWRLKSSEASASFPTGVVVVDLDHHPQPRFG